MNQMAAGGAGLPHVAGIMMERLNTFLLATDPDELQVRLDEWDNTRRVFDQNRRDFEDGAKLFREAFGETSLTGDEGEWAFKKSADEMAEKADDLGRAVTALSSTRNTVTQAKIVYAQLKAQLPPSHGPRPDPNDVKYATTGVGSDPANAARLQADNAKWEAEEAAIADAESQAARQCDLVVASIQESDPHVRKITENPYTPPSTQPGSGEFPGSASAISASQAKIARTNASTLYADGMGYDIIAHEKANIAAHQEQNVPEWNNDNLQWVNADGSPAPAVAFSGVIDPDGASFNPLVVGGALAGLGVTAGAMKMLASRMAAMRAARAGAGASRVSPQASTARTAGGAARTGSAAGRNAGRAASGAAGRGGPGGRGAARGMAGSGSRAGMKGAGKKDDKQGGGPQAWEADYTDDWAEPVSDVLDPSIDRGPMISGPQDETADKKPERDAK